MTIGLEPDRITKSLPQIKTVDAVARRHRPGDIDAALHGPGRQAELLRRDRAGPRRRRATRTMLRPKLAPIPGVFFQHGQGVVAPAGVLERATCSARVGEITAERLKELGAPYRVGDIVGLGGLQSAFEKRLAGRPTGTVVIEAGPKTVRTVKTLPGPRAAAGRLTIDPQVQQAAETALAGVTQARRARGDRHHDRADPRRRVEARRRLRPRARRHLSARLDVQGDHVDRAARRGQHRLDAGAVPGRRSPSTAGRSRTSRARRRARSISREAFKISCNNAFIGLADKLPADALTKAATLVRVQRALVAAGAVVRRLVPEAEATAPSAPRRRSARAACSRARCRWRRSRPRSRPGSGTRPSLTTQPAAVGPSAPRSTPASSRRCAAFMASVVRSRRHRRRRRPPGRHVRQDRHRRVRQRQPARDARVVHRLPRQPRVRGDRRGRRRRRARRRAPRGAVPQHARGRLAGPSRYSSMPSGMRTEGSIWPVKTPALKPASASNCTPVTNDERGLFEEQQRPRLLVGTRVAAPQRLREVRHEVLADGLLEVRHHRRVGGPGVEAVDADAAAAPA